MVEMLGGGGGGGGSLMLLTQDKFGVTETTPVISNDGNHFHLQAPFQQ